jgi:hypothetical protein
MRQCALIIAILIMFASALHAGAAEPKMTLNDSSTIKDVLSQNIGKRVAVKTDANEALDGTVVKVTGQLVYIEKLVGKEYFDAIVRIDRISSITFRVRTN